MVGECSIAGVDYIKLQALSKEKIDRHPELDWYADASVNYNNISRIDTICKNNHIKWFATPFYPEAVEMLDPYVDMYKIDYSNRNNNEIIEKCARNKKVIVSEDSPNKIHHFNVQEIYCNPLHPTRLGDINFDMVKEMKGYSNHCMDPLAILKAKRLGAEYIEFHLTSDPNRFAMDNRVSMTFGQMREFMRWIK